MITDIQVKIFSKSGKVPLYASKGDAAVDLIATEVKESPVNSGFIEYGTGIHLEIPEGFAGFIFPRSSISKYGLIMANCVGVVDSGYRGEVTARFRRIGESIYSVGEKIGQLIIMPVPKVEFELVDSLEVLTESERGQGGYGSTGK